MNLMEHAINEIKYYALDSDYTYGDLINTAVLELVQLFANQGHSGGSASVVRSLFTKLTNFEPLTPLTGSDDEWIAIPTDMETATLAYQNKRCHHVFKDKDGCAYDIDAVVYHDVTDGSYFQKGGEIHYITFPYTPAQIVIDVDAQGNPINGNLTVAA